MADGAEANRRVIKFKDAAVILAHDANIMAQKLKHFLGKGEYERAEGLAAGLQRVARDVKWLMQRQPKG